jgi:hypothetical protein
MKIIKSSINLFVIIITSLGCNKTNSHNSSSALSQSSNENEEKEVCIESNPKYNNLIFSFWYGANTNSVDSITTILKREKILAINPIDIDPYIITNKYAITICDVPFGLETQYSLRCYLLTDVYLEPIIPIKHGSSKFKEILGLYKSKYRITHSDLEKIVFNEANKVIIIYKKNKPCLRQYRFPRNEIEKMELHREIIHAENISFGDENLTEEKMLSTIPKWYKHEIVPSFIIRYTNYDNYKLQEEIKRKNKDNIKDKADSIKDATYKGL